MRARPRHRAPIAGVGIVGVDDGGGRRARDRTPSRPRPCATPSRSPKPSRCSAPALVIRPTRRRARRTSSATSPMRFAPISITALRCAASRRISVTRHTDVIVEIAVGRHAQAHARQNRRGHFLDGGLAVAAADRDDRQDEVARASACASSCSARSASGTTICGSAPRHRALDHGADGAARRGRLRRTRAPSKFGPRSATNSAPGISVRLSVDTAP